MMGVMIWFLIMMDDEIKIRERDDNDKDNKQELDVRDDVDSDYNNKFW